MNEDTNRLIELRREKAQALREQGVNPFPTTVSVTHTTQQLRDMYGEKEAEAIEQVPDRFAIAGRVKGQRDFGNVIFLDIYDRTGRLQVLLSKKLIGPENFKSFKKMADIGDIYAFAGKLMKTRTGELSLAADELTLQCKSMRPLPEKFHGLVDVETRYRQRYLDLIMNPDVVDVFRTRSEIIRLMRVFFSERDFLEVETPMMHPIAGGATARPFVTHHNTLDMDLFLRIAPELYLKRLIVGGLERVFEVNRNFRNEGISTQHNPEFTMLEFYWAYATYEQLMELTEELCCFLAHSLFGKLSFAYQEQEIDFARPWKRLRMADAVAEYTDLSVEDLADAATLKAFCAKHGIEIIGEATPGRLTVLIFEELVESKLVQPTFIYHFPTEVSPLARRNDENPEVVDRFELYINGNEIANAFNELADPDDQRGRFVEQVEAKKAGDEEAHEYDADYIRALEYGLPPTAGEGIGIDRLVMLLTNSASIRDVILFPQMRKEQS
ncbi:MAG TPA: lysine--tRNA ligase [bacterium]|nr:lysine--tRNA ligase [bacterium]